MVARDDDVAEPFHVRGGGVLADAAEVMPEVAGHGLRLNGLVRAISTRS
jgi:hypothetical protein